MSATLHAFAGYGLKLEYMIVDRASLAVRPVAPHLLERMESLVAGDGTHLGWSNAFVAHVMTLKNERPSTQLEPIVGGFEAEIARANAALAEDGARLMPSGMHPWMDPTRETILWPHDPDGIYAAYQRIFDCRSHGWANVQSAHLNLPFAEDDEFGRLHAAIRLVMPIIPALAASSPFWGGQRAPALDQRMVVYRTNAAPLESITGEVVPEPASSRAEYEARILKPMYDEIAALDPEGTLRHEWLNARGAIARFDRQAIEIRVLDVQECPLADVAIAAAVSAVVRAVWEREAHLPLARNTLETGALAAVLEACVRHGEQAPIVDPSYLSMLGYPGPPCRAGELWAHLVMDCPPDAPVHTPAIRDALDAILDEGPLARRLVRAVGRHVTHERLRQVYAQLCDCLQAGRMFVAD